MPAYKLKGPSEAAEQECLFIWANFHVGKYPELTMLHHIPNGGKRDARTGARMKRQGVKPGIPDLCLPVARGEHHGLYIELKRQAKGAAPTRNQNSMILKLREQGYYAVVCSGWIAARDVLVAYLEGRL